VGAAWPEGERDLAWTPVERVLTDPEFAPIFSGTSRAEVSVMGTLKVGSHERIISGQIDRLAVTANDVFIMDYKTNRPPPERLDEVPEGYVAQLALYRALLSPLYPQRVVRAALLFTESPRLIELPEKLMNEALVRLGAR
jgi:ATP-dependent helicase/nuclease subunit A